MATIILTMPDEALPRVVAATAARFGYRAKLPDGSDNPEGQGQFALRMVRETVKGWVKEYEATLAAQTAAATARAAAEADVDADVVIT